MPGKKDQPARWNRILRERVHSPEEPQEYVISFAESLGRARTRQILDLGCGAGRHLVCFEIHGLKAYGIDFAQTGLSTAKKRLRSQGLDALLIRSDMKMLPFIDSCFDMVVSTRAIYHQRLEEVRRTVLEIRRVLKRGASSHGSSIHKDA